MVNNKDAWKALSIKDKASLINKYVSGGMLDLKEMKKHYNGFENEKNLLSGEENNESALDGKKPTLEEYLQHKRDSTINAALEKSYTRTKGIEIPYEFGENEKS